MSRNWIFYLEDILESAQKIRRYSEGLTFEQFQSQAMVFDAVVRNLEIIGEAAKHLPPGGTVMMSDVTGAKWPVSAMSSFMDTSGWMLTSSGMSCSQNSRSSFHPLRKRCIR